MAVCAAIWLAGCQPPADDRFGPFWAPHAGVSYLADAESGVIVHAALVVGQEDGQTRSSNLARGSETLLATGSAWHSADFLPVSCRSDFSRWSTHIPLPNRIAGYEEVEALAHPAEIRTQTIRLDAETVLLRVLFHNPATEEQDFYAALAATTGGTAPAVVLPIDDMESSQLAWERWGGARLLARPHGNGRFLQMTLPPSAGFWRGAGRVVTHPPASASTLDMDILSTGRRLDLSVLLQTDDSVYSSVLVLDWVGWRRVSIPLRSFRGADGTLRQEDLPRIASLRIGLRGETPDGATIGLDNIAFDTQHRQLATRAELRKEMQGVVLRHPALEGAVGIVPANLAGDWPEPTSPQALAQPTVLLGEEFAPVLRDGGQAEELMRAGTLETDGRGLWAIVQQRRVRVPPGQTRQVAFLLARSPTGDPGDLRNRLQRAIGANVLQAPPQRLWIQDVQGPLAEAARATAAQALLNLCYDRPGGRLVPIPSRYYGRFYSPDAGAHAVGLAACCPHRCEQACETILRRALPDEPPIAIQAWWVLYLRNHDLGTLRKHYDAFFAAWEQRTLLDTDGDGLPNVNPAIHRAGMGDLPVWDAAEGRILETPDAAALMIREAKILQLAAEQLGRPSKERDELKQWIARAETALNRQLWNERLGWYVAHTARGRTALPVADVLTGAYPLAAGSVPPDRIGRLVERLADPQRYWAGFGLRSVDRSSPLHAGQDGARWRGAVWIYPTWLLWRGLLDAGEADRASQLARGVLDNYSQQFHQNNGACFEYFHSSTGQGLGVRNASGFTTPILDFYAACCIPGTVTSGFDTLLRDVHYDALADRLRFRAARPHRNGFTGFHAVMGKPGGMYRRSNGDVLQAGPDGEVSFALRIAKGQEVAVELSPYQPPDLSQEAAPQPSMPAERPDDPSARPTNATPELPDAAQPGRP